MVQGRRGPSRVRPRHRPRQQVDPRARDGRSVTFYCGTRTVRREVRGVIFTERTRDCLKFNFSFGVEGTRGKPHPPPTPTEDLDELYG